MIERFADRDGFPFMATVGRRFETKSVRDVPALVRQQLAALNTEARILPGQRVAITAGSRGIRDIVAVIRTVVEVMRSRGAEPFIVPAMGSHGGATAQGQTQLLSEYGITEDSTGAPIHSSMEVEVIGQCYLGFPVYVDRLALSADHIVVINRIKPHTDFEAPIESGLIKMMAIGLGKQKGAELYHNAILHYGYHETFLAVAQTILKHAPVAIGIGIVENQSEETHEIRACWKEDIEVLERNMLIKAKALLPRLPFEQLDLLIVDEMGKEISGTGMDQNVIARTVIRMGSVPQRPIIRRIFVRDLSPKTRGTATGIGNADFTTRRLVEKIDRHATYVNCLTACEPEMAAIPPYYDTDREALVQAFKTLGMISRGQEKIAHIKNTLRLEEIRISEVLVDEAVRHGFKIVRPAEPLAFNAGGNLICQWQPE